MTVMNVPYVELAKIVAKELDQTGASVVDYKPGNGTRYLMVLAETTDGLMVALPHWRVSNLINARDEVAVDVVESTIGYSRDHSHGLSAEDCRVVAEFLSLVGVSHDLWKIWVCEECGNTIDQSGTIGPDHKEGCCFHDEHTTMCEDGCGLHVDHDGRCEEK